MKILNGEMWVKFKGAVFLVEKIFRASIYNDKNFFMKLTIKTDREHAQIIDRVFVVGTGEVFAKNIFINRDFYDFLYQDPHKVKVEVLIELDFRVVESMLSRFFSTDYSKYCIKDKHKGGDRLVFDLSPEYIKEYGEDIIIENESYSSSDLKKIFDELWRENVKEEEE